MSDSLLLHWPSSALTYKVGDRHPATVPSRIAQSIFVGIEGGGDCSSVGHVVRDGVFTRLSHTSLHYSPQTLHAEPLKRCTISLINGPKDQTVYYEKQRLVGCEIDSLLLQRKIS